MEHVIILGGGPAGFTAALYAARANLAPLVLTGRVLGGQLSLTSEIENYPGFPEGLGGMELMEKFQQQAERFGAVIKYEEVTAVRFRPGEHHITTDSAEYTAKAVVICTGSSPRLLNVPGEERFFGRGISTCATCDGAFYKGRNVIVIGGGDSAMEEGTFLTRFATKVHVVHRRDQLRASPIMQDRAFANPKLAFVWDSVVEEVLGDDTHGVTGARLRNLKTNAQSVLDADGLFIAIGHVPNTQLFKGQVDLDEQGYIVTDRRQRTNIPGVFAGGDVQDHVYRQAITAAGTGCAAAIEAERYLAELEHGKG
ncbi:MAG: thioredoxin-disulfide reductase [Candidatus Latescibacteria bacterium]|nr:thioredoxin-disulfide reductase [Candidatus Latescibacterota bacterium]